jgi:hypothetical protein
MATTSRKYITYPKKTARREIDYFPTSERVSGSPRMIEYTEPGQTIFKRDTRYIREG